MEAKVFILFYFIFYSLLRRVMMLLVKNCRIEGPLRAEKAGVDSMRCESASLGAQRHGATTHETGLNPLRSGHSVLRLNLNFFFFSLKERRRKIMKIIILT